MAYYQSPIAFQLQSFTNQGVILSAGRIYTYIAGTTTPQATYTDSGALTLNANPIVLDSSGRLTTSIWVLGGVSLKVIIKDSADNTLATIDNISGINDIGNILLAPGPIGSTTASTGAFTTLSVSGATTFGGNVTGQVVTANSYFTGPIGSSTKNTGQFTSVTATSDIFSTQDASAASVVLTGCDSATTSSAYAIVQMRRARGTSAAPATLADGDIIGYLQFYGYNGTAYTSSSYIRAQADGAFSGSNNKSRIIVATAQGGTSVVESARWTAEGDYYVGATSNNIGTGNTTNTGHTLTAAGRATHAASANSALVLNRLTSDGACAAFMRGGVTVGSITVDTTSTAYATSSDYRLKMDVTGMTGALALIQRMRPVEYLWIAGRKPGSGFIAHELQEVVPSAVTGTKDAVDADGNPDYQSVDFSKLVPTLVSAMQEQQTLIEALQARLTSAEQSLSALRTQVTQSAPPAAPQNG